MEQGRTLQGKSTQWGLELRPISMILTIPHKPTHNTQPLTAKNHLLITPRENCPPFPRLRIRLHDRLLLLAGKLL